MGKYLDQQIASQQTTWIKELLAESNKGAQSLKVLELGSGTGLGGISLTKLLEKIGCQAEVYMTDVCEKALEVIQTNLQANNLKTAVNLKPLEWGVHGNQANSFPQSLQG